MIARLSSVDAAKKRIPAIPPRQLLEIAAAAKSMPTAKQATSDDLVEFLRSGLKHHGAGIPTLICMLAVTTNGDYSPMDRKVARGLAAKQKITEEDEAALTATPGNVPKFAKIYVEKVLPAWRESMAILQSPEQADNSWANADGRA